jgi:uncharacterized membrane protein YgdD (TMEM256/DUF423 family)
VKLFVSLGSLAAMAGVALGAFGAHGLKNRVSPELLATWNTGVLYHLIHALGLILIGVLCHLMSEVLLVRIAGWFIVAGILLFSCSLYVLVLTEVRGIGIVTPFGGIAFIAGWLMLAVATWKFSD